jgi:hypothetical protein
MKRQIRETPLDAGALRQLRQLRLEALLFSGGALGTARRSGGSRIVS